ncbi:MAG TPA: family 1 glycosylhydrolase [Terriglobales bacterium]|nr:family 1 glycosylhydrolase [Terriglobales bacterium]
MEIETHHSPPPQMWAGVECTVARIGNRYTNQMAAIGHASRPGDFERFAQLGIRALRLPVLWELVSPVEPKQHDWEWPDHALAEVKRLGIRPIVGLLHHGSGPGYTNLLDPQFSELLADHARAVAERYPWVDAYTPVNEPLTTARFSALYGHWYPHARHHTKMAQCLLHECRATILSMRAIRKVNPSAHLVQTEDLGEIFSTPLLTYQAAFENERRWLAWDLLCGRVDRNHPLYLWLLWIGVPRDELQWIKDNACPPDVIGVNHYLSSNRYLDEHIERYPVHSHGGNRKHRYADVLAARVVPDDLASPEKLLREAWERYQIPVAVTEVHNGCTREEQLRWLKYVWQGAANAKRSGANILAVTAWSLLGAVDWDSLLTAERDHYEPGVFDVRGPEPRATALVPMIQSLARGETPSHPVLAQLGWWQRHDRYHFGHQPEPRGKIRQMKAPARPILITGATGTLGQAFARMCVVRGLAYQLLRRSEMDIANAESIAGVLQRLNPWAVVNAAGYVRVDNAEVERDRCYQENAIGPGLLARACAQRRIPMVTFSSDLVFDGRKGSPYVESDPVSPLNEYGRSKAAAERMVLAEHPGALVIRTSAFFGPWDQYNFVTLALNALTRGERFVTAEDAVISPTYIPDLVQNTLDLLIDGEHGIWHLANDGVITWADLATLAAERAGLDPHLIHRVAAASLSLAAPRPAYSALASERGQLLPPLLEALTKYTRDRVDLRPGAIITEFEAAS